MTIVAIVGVAALAAFGAELRAANRARQTLPAAALAQERLATLNLVDANELRRLPDSLARGTFAKPLDNYAWHATVKEVPGEPALVELTVRVEWPDGSYVATERRYRPTVVGIATR
jgi:type II secretory pathway pseudopilin PulG